MPLTTNRFTCSATGEHTIGATAPGTFPAGTYTCRVSIDGQVEVTSTFSVG